MGAAPRRGAFQTSSDLSIIASSDSDYDSEESDSSDDSDSRDDEGDEEDEVEEEEEDMVLDYPQEDSDSRRDLDTCKLCSP